MHVTSTLRGGGCFLGGLFGCCLGGSSPAKVTVPTKTNLHLISSASHMHHYTLRRLLHVAPKQQETLLSLMITKTCK